MARPKLLVPQEIDFSLSLEQSRQRITTLDMRETDQFVCREKCEIS